jgi:hypothetical protein
MRQEVFSREIERGARQSELREIETVRVMISVKTVKVESGEFV